MSKKNKDAEGTPKKKGKKKWIIIGAIAVVVIGIGAAGGKEDDDQTNNKPDTSVTNDESKDQEEPQTKESTEKQIETIENTPDDKLINLSIGDSVTIDGVTVSVDSINSGESALGIPTFEVSITYKNNSGKSLSITPYDWCTILHTGSDKAHVGGDVSFHLQTIKDGEEWSGIVTLWDEDKPEKIKFESSTLSKSATWLLPAKNESPDETEKETIASTSTTTNTSDDNSSETSENVALDNTPESDSNLTTGQKNALKSAESYIELSAFSYLNLIEQLEYEEYSHEEAVYAAENCGADWNAEALESAKSYIEISDYSYQGLFEQLEYEQFTSEQAQYGVDNCGADWFQEAADCAENYISTSSFSRDELLDQLLYEGFTQEQAEHGVQSVGY